MLSTDSAPPQPDSIFSMAAIIPQSAHLHKSKSGSGVVCSPLTLQVLPAVDGDPHHHCSSRGSYISPCFSGLPSSSPHSRTATAVTPTSFDPPPLATYGEPRSSVLCADCLPTVAQQLCTSLQSWLRYGFPESLSQTLTKQYSCPISNTQRWMPVSGFSCHCPVVYKHIDLT